MTRHYWVGGNRSYEQDRFFEESLDKDRWQKGDSPDAWDACWYTGMPDPEFFRHIGPDRRINHIPGNNALTVKSRLYQSLLTLRDRVSLQDNGYTGLGDRLKFFPRVYSMPGDYHAFQQEALDEPSKRWILKPKNAARGKGIQLVKDPANVPMDSSWMVQEYIENPHTMHGRKYVLRLYVAVTSVEPLRVYLYRQGFAKLASAPYDEENADNPYSYLTNPDVNALNLDADVPVEFVDLDRYRAWLREQGHDDGALFDRVEDIVALTCLSAVESMRERARAIGADTRGCYELLGIDCLVDDKLKPWVLECNLSPSLDVCAGPESGGDIEEGVKGTLVADLVSLVGLNGKPEPVPGASPEQQLILETENELARAGNFKRLLPSENPAAYLPFYTLPRLEDWVVAKALAGDDLSQPTLQRRCAEDMISDDRVYVYDTRLGHLSVLNEIASLIWLMATDGIAPDDIADALTQSARQNASAEPDTWTIRRDVWNSLAEWANNGFLVQASAGDTPATERSSTRNIPLPQVSEPYSCVLECGGFHVELFTDSPAVVSRIGALLLPLESKSRPGTRSRLEIVRDIPGYTLILDGKVVQSRLALSRLAPAVVGCLTGHAADEGDIIIDAGLVARSDDPESAVLVANSDPGLGDAPALALASHMGANFGRALRIPAEPDTALFSLGLPAQVPHARAVNLAPPGSFPVHSAKDGHEVMLHPASQGMVGQAYRVNTVLIPGQLSAQQKAPLCAVSVSEAMRYLIPGCCGPDGRPLDTAGFSRLAEWLETADRYLVDADNLDGVVAQLSGVGRPEADRAFGQ
ncbi:amylase [Marinobacter sp. ATCH36]|uniref:amylase n=1 Tax=Marinobacter sp. ATCH36 TaxID=2945106 RepID=UPI0020202A80|nr:amylase [Marinobacter sp. ATCH36]MCL7942615.1 amylase [Marinobacter sp. ATCH36]